MSKFIKKVIFFGSTGNTGLATVEYALKNGYEVSIFVRDPSKVPPEMKPDMIITGDVLNKDQVIASIEGQDAVVVTLGTRNDLSPTNMMSEGLKNIVEGMVKHGVKRISCCISSFLFWDRSKVPSSYIPITEDHERMLNVLKSSDREWTAIFPPHISNEPAHGNYVLKNDEPVGRMISKYDLGEIMVKCLSDDERIRRTVGMGYPIAQA